VRGEVGSGQVDETMVQHQHIGLTQPRLLDDRGRLVRDAAHVDGVGVRLELLEVADDSCDLVRDEYADHLRPPHAQCIERMVRRMAHGWTRCAATRHSVTAQRKRGAGPMAGSS